MAAHARRQDVPNEERLLRALQQEEERVARINNVEDAPDLDDDDREPQGTL